jgi:hypothetical protein
MNQEFVPTKAYKNRSPVRIFVSYSRENYDIVKEIVRALEKSNGDFKFWIDDKNIPVGNELAQKVKQSIERCDFGLLMVSSSFESPFILEHELPHFIQIEQSAISPAKTPIPIFVNDKKEIDKLMYILDSHMTHNEPGGSIPNAA